MTANAAAVLGCADRKGLLGPGFDADLVLLGAHNWRHLAYHLGGDVGVGGDRRGAFRVGALGLARGLEEAAAAA